MANLSFKKKKVKKMTEKNKQILNLVFIQGTSNIIENRNCIFTTANLQIISEFVLYEPVFNSLSLGRLLAALESTGNSHYPKEQTCQGTPFNEETYHCDSCITHLKRPNRLLLQLINTKFSGDLFQ